MKVKESCTGIIECKYKNGSLIYRLYDEQDRTRILVDDNGTFNTMLSKYVCMGKKRIKVEGDIQLVSDSCVVFSGNNLVVSWA